jgi:hypothetical protein
LVYDRMTNEDRRQAQLREDSREAQSNPLYAVGVKYVSADKARATGVPVDPNLPHDAKVGVLNHEVAYDPKYGREEDEVPSEGS